MFMVTEVYDDERCHRVWFSVLQICYHGVCADVGVCTSPELVWNDLYFDFLGSVDVYVYYCAGSWWYLYVLFSETDDIDGVWYSAVSAMTSLFCVNWWVFALVHDIPMQFWIEKSLPKIIGLFKCSHTMNV